MGILFYTIPKLLGIVFSEAEDHSIWETADWLLGSPFMLSQPSALPLFNLDARGPTFGATKN